MSDISRFRFLKALLNKRIFTLRRKLLLTFGGIFTVMYAVGILTHLFGIPFTGFGGEYGTRRAEAFRHLNLIADIEKARILSWIEERKSDMTIMSQDRHLAGEVVALKAAIDQKRMRGITDEQLWEEVQRLDVFRSITDKLIRIKASYPEYEYISVVEWSTLSVIATSRLRELGENHASSFRADSQLILYGDNVYVSDISADDVSGAPALHLAATVREHGSDNASPGEVIGLLLIEVKPDEIIKPLLHIGDGLGRTGEVLLLDRNHKTLTELKHPLADGSKVIPLQHTIEAVPAVLASHGSEGLVASLDYRGEEVLAAIRHIRVSPDVSWGMVTKIDAAEAYDPLNEATRITLFAGFVGVVILLGFIVLISNSLSKPIVSLSRIATEVEKGNLSARSSNSASDEVGLLARSFNSMVARVEAGQIELEAQVDARTGELKIKNEALNKEITDRKEAQEALRLSEERWQFAIEGSGDGIWDWDRLADHVFYSDRWKRILGYEPNEIANQFDEWEWRLHADEKEDFLGNIRELVDGTTYRIQVEHRLLCKDGSYKWVLGRGQVVARSETGLATRIIGTMTDITERKQAEEALLLSEDKFRRIAERIFDVIIMADLDGLITYASPSVEKVLGYQPDDIIGKHLMDLTPEPYLLSIIKIFQQTSEGISVEGCKSAMYRKDGSVADIEIDTSPIFKDGHVIGSQAIVRDITETKRLQELESRAQRLETAGQVAAQVAHDFNNLLGPLMAYPELMRDELPKDHPALPYLADMEQSASQIAEINQQLLTLSRRGHYNQESLNLNEVILEAAREHDQLSPQLVIETRLDTNLMNIMAGRAQIYRVLSNLIHNARDAMQDVGRICIKTENYYVESASAAYGQVPKGEYVKLTVSDTGQGIPDDEMQRIFDPFYSTKTADRRRGSGLGLSVVDAVIKDHGGHIDLSSEPGKGTSFYFYFPITRDAAGSVGASSIVGGSEKVLVIDDDQVQRKVSLKLLRKLGYDATCVSSGEEAVSFLKENPRDLLILDMIMPPGIDGTETYRRALKLNPSQRAIVISGFAESERVQLALELGAGTFVRKPLALGVLAAAIRAELDRKVLFSATESSLSAQSKWDQN